MPKTPYKFNLRTASDDEINFLPQDEITRIGVKGPYGAAFESAPSTNEELLLRSKAVRILDFARSRLSIRSVLDNAQDLAAMDGGEYIHGLNELLPPGGFYVSPMVYFGNLMSTLKAAHVKPEVVEDSADIIADEVVASLGNIRMMVERKGFIEWRRNDIFYAAAEGDASVRNVAYKVLERGIRNHLTVRTSVDILAGLTINEGENRGEHRSEAVEFLSRNFHVFEEGFRGDTSTGYCAFALSLIVKYGERQDAERAVAVLESGLSDERKSIYATRGLSGIIAPLQHERDTGFFPVGGKVTLLRRQIESPWHPKHWREALRTNRQEVRPSKA